MSEDNYCPPTPPPSGRTTPENYDHMRRRMEDGRVAPQENGHIAPNANGDSTGNYQQVGWREHILPMFIWALLPTAEGVEEWSIVWVPEYQSFNIPMYMPERPPARQPPGIPRGNSE